MARVDDIIARKWSLSIELWPPRTDEAAARLTSSLETFEKLEPTFASITYGAAGSTRDRTHDMVVGIQRRAAMTPMAHLTCAAHSREELTAILQRYQHAGIENVLALRGDPAESAEGRARGGDFVHAIELVELAKSLGPFCVAVAAHPGMHPSASDVATDRRHLAEKLQVADLAITQFFFEANEYFQLVDDLGSLGVDKPVIPGIMPITSPRTLTRMAELASCAIPPLLEETVRQVGDNPFEVAKVGIEVATQLCDELITAGVPGLHFYTMNQVHATVAICDNLGISDPADRPVGFADNTGR